MWWRSYWRATRIHVWVRIYLSITPFSLEAATLDIFTEQKHVSAHCSAVCPTDELFFPPSWLSERHLAAQAPDISHGSRWRLKVGCVRGGQLSTKKVTTGPFFVVKLFYCPQMEKKMLVKVTWLKKNQRMLMLKSRWSPKTFNRSFLSISRPTILQSVSSTLHRDVCPSGKCCSTYLHMWI